MKATPPDRHKLNSMQPLSASVKGKQLCALEASRSATGGMRFCTIFSRLCEGGSGILSQWFRTKDAITFVVARGHDDSRQRCSWCHGCSAASFT